MLFSSLPETPLSPYAPFSLLTLSVCKHADMFSILVYVQIQVSTPKLSQLILMLLKYNNGGTLHWQEKQRILTDWIFYVFFSINNFKHVVSLLAH